MTRFALIAVPLLLLSATPAAAYVGPGAGISVIGTAIAFVGALVFAIVGFVWYPLKRLLAAVRTRGDHDNGPPAS
jgi:uncharacterized membrane protein